MTVDADTVAYFDENLPEYDVERLEYVAEFIRRHSNADSSLLDIGCGTGNGLEFLSKSTSIRQLAGIDVSPKYLAKTSQRVTCATYQGSILDRAFVRGIERKFSFVVLAAVLHHLIGRTRRESAELAWRAVENALTLLEPNGYLVILEPIFYPSLAMDGLFYTKKAVTRVTKRRVPIFGEWNNIGPPVVSYFTNERLFEMIRTKANAVVVEADVKDRELRMPLKLFLRRNETTVVVQRHAW